MRVYIVVGRRVQVVLLWFVVGHLGCILGALTVLPEVTVSGRSDVASAEPGALFPPGSSGHDLGGVRVQSQGVGQADLRLRGLPFSSTGLSLSGLALRNPQTEHFHFELPLPSALLTSPEVQTGVAQVLGGTAHLGGSVSLELAPVQERQLLQVGIGDRGSRFGGYVGEAFVPGVPQWGVSAFGLQEVRGGADHGDNDMSRRLGGLRLQHRSPGNRLDLLASRQRRQFGARGYYGASAAYPAEEDLDDILLFAAGEWVRRDAGPLRLAASWRQLDDHYVLDRYRPYVYENQHRSRTFAAALSSQERVVPERLTLLWRAEIEQEHLDSTAFGEFRRERLGMLLAPRVTLGPVTLTGGGRALFFSDDSPVLLGFVRAAYRVASGHEVRIDVTDSIRQPSYTELYTRSLSSIGNSTLSRERSRGVELAWDGVFSQRVRGHAAVFVRRSSHTVDWVQSGPGSAWQATDLGDVSSRGVELDISVTRLASWDLDLSYVWVDTSADVSPYASRYVLDYARHQAGLDLSRELLPGLRLTCRQTLLRHAANRARRSDGTAVLGGLGLDYMPRNWSQCSLSLWVENVWGDRFESYPGQRSAGRRVALVATYAF